MLQLPEDMMGGRIATTQSLGIQEIQNNELSSRVALIPQYAGLDPVLIASQAAGCRDKDAHSGMLAAQAVGGTQYDLGLPSTSSQWVPNDGTGVSFVSGRKPDGGRGRG